MLFAHKDKESGKEQELMEHLEAVAEAMRRDIDYAEFPQMSRDELSQLLFETGRCHDAGKATTYFQDYLDGKDTQKKNHAYISAVIFAQKEEMQSLNGAIGFLAILRHHGAMRAKAEDSGQEFTYLPEKYRNWRQNIGAYYPREIRGTKGEISAEEIKEYLFYIRDLSYPRNISDHRFFALQYIFSKLIWADKMNSAETAERKEGNFPTPEEIDRYILSKSKAQQEAEKASLQTGGLNADRMKIREEILDKLKSLSDEELRQQRVFTITSPTGSGKTLSSMTAAVYLAERLSRIYGSRPKIITALPFINILEQTRMDYENLFENVLVHHSLEELTLGTEEDPLSRRYLLTQSWESEVVITTFVQFFESIFTGSNRRLLKLHKLSRSIVILDEIQALPAQYYGLIGAAVKRISEYYGTRFILMTATKPEIVYFAQQLLSNEDLPNKALRKEEKNTSMQTTELLSNNQYYYEKLSRTELIPCMDRVRNEEELADFMQATKKKEQSAVVVMNTIRRSIRTFHLLKERYQEECEILYLSTNLISLDRRAVIQKAKKLEKEKVPFILVSTQTIEAGVDLDFDIGYRDLAPLESVIQAAGRVNRAGRKGEYAPVYIFDTGDWKKVYALFEMDRTKKLLCRGYRENQYKELIEGYYGILKSVMETNLEIYNEGILKLDYEIIEKFKMIERNYQVYKIIIEKDEQIRRTLEELNEMYRQRYRDFETKLRLSHLLSQAERYTVEVPEGRVKRGQLISYAQLYGIDLSYFIVPMENLAECYSEDTGYLFDEQEWKQDIFF